MPEAIGIAIAWAIFIGAAGTMVTVFTAVRARIRNSTPSSGASPAELAELAELRESVQRLDGEVADLTERVDFAERLLAKQREAERVKGGQ